MVTPDSDPILQNLHGRVARLERDLKASEQARMQAESLVDNFQARVNSLENKLKNLDGENAVRSYSHKLEALSSISFID